MSQIENLDGRSQKFGYNKKGSNVKTVCSICLEEKPQNEITAKGRKYVCEECGSQ